MIYKNNLPKWVVLASQPSKSTPESSQDQAFKWPPFSFKKSDEKIQSSRNITFFLHVYSITRINSFIKNRAIS